MVRKENVDRILESNDQNFLCDAGAVSHTLMEQTVREIYDDFAEKRKSFDAISTDEKEILELQNIVKSRTTE